MFQGLTVLHFCWPSIWWGSPCAVFPRVLLDWKQWMGKYFLLFCQADFRLYASQTCSVIFLFALLLLGNARLSDSSRTCACFTCLMEGLGVNQVIQQWKMYGLQREDKCVIIHCAMLAKLLHCTLPEGFHQLHQPNYTNIFSFHTGEGW